MSDIVRYCLDMRSSTKTSPPDVVWLTLQEAAARARYSPRTLERYISAGKLTAYRGPGGRLRLRSVDVDGLFTPVTPEALR